MRGASRAARAAGLAAALLFVGGATAAEGGFWGRDINAGQGPKLLEEVRPALLEVVRSPEAARPAAIRKFAEKAEASCEGWKRFRNPELRPLFLHLLGHSDWHTSHRALFALERMPGRDALIAAWKLLFHSERRLREKAAIACIRMWDKSAAPDLSKGDSRNALESLIGTEGDPHVRRAFEALRRRMDGKLPVERVYEEFTVKGPDGLVLTPFLEGMDRAPAVAPGYAAKGVSRGGGPSAAKLPVADAWTTPLLGFGEEEVSGTSLQPFANPREGGRVHTGLDVGACLDGAGYYAAADGVVKFVHSGSDMGTLLVLEHHGHEGVVCAVYMHGGDTVFVQGGDRVEAGQLIGSMGMSFSLENGGHFAHLHYGLYPGPFQSNHNYGYKKAADGLDDWLDPAKCLPRWRDGSLPGATEAPEAVTERATRLRKSGRPARAAWILEQGAKVLKGKPGAESLSAAAAEWKKDALFQKALKGEERIESLKEAAAKAGPKDRDRVKGQWQKLLEEYGDTDLAERIREEIR